MAGLRIGKGGADDSITGTLEITARTADLCAVLPSPAILLTIDLYLARSCQR